MIRTTLATLVLLSAWTAGASGPPVRSDAEVVNWNVGVNYTYDGSGNITSIGSDTFRYDSVGRLVESGVNGVSRVYEYDPFGNRTACRQGAQQTDCQEQAVTSATNRLTGQGHQYNASGGLEYWTGHTYTYDALDMQTGQQVAGTTAREYVYTADDERIAVYTTSGWWQWTVRDTSGRVLREFTSQDSGGSLGTVSWQWVKDFVYRDDKLLVSRQIPPNATTANTYHYHLDHLGTPRRITNDADVIVGHHDYHPFGPEAPGGLNEASLTRLMYTGHERDVIDNTPEALDYMHARYYDPKAGRFLSVDPAWSSADLGKPQSWNRYSYVRNNPINAIDPDGRSPVAVALRVVASGARLCASSAPCAQRALAAGINLTGLGMSLNERFEENKAKWEQEQQNELPDNPDELLDKGYEETSHPDAAAAGHRTFENPETGDKLRFDKGKEGKPGHEGRDHYHRENPNATGKKDQYLDAGGKPVPRGSDASHLYPKSWWDRLKESLRK